MPTEKDVQYYEELVQREVSCKDLSFGCKVIVSCYEKHFEEGKGVHYQHRGNSNGCMTNERGTVLINNYNAVSVDDELDDNTQSFSMMRFGDKTYIIKEILGHEVMIGDFLDWLSEHYSTFTKTHKELSGEKYELDKCRFYAIRLWTNKRLPYSALPDSTKIELGKIVEEVLLSKEK